MSLSKTVDRKVLVELFERRHRALSPIQRRMAEYVLRNYQDVAFMSVVELARAADASPAAVVRFAVALGFGGYPAFQRVLRGIIRRELRQVDKFAASLRSNSEETLVDRVLTQELANLERLRAAIDGAALKESVRTIADADGVAVVGFRAASTLAHYIWYNLRKVKPRVQLFTAPGSVTLDDLILTDRKSAVILVAFPRYSRELLDLAGIVKTIGVAMIGITDNELSPLVGFCKRSLLVEVGDVSFTDFFAAPIALANALVAEVAARLEKRALARLRRLDDIAAEQRFLFSYARAPSRGRPVSSRTRDVT
jgi:DNA-binding MurR/RpiR family transcriptional regulator